MGRGRRSTYLTGESSTPYDGLWGQTLPWGLSIVCFVGEEASMRMIMLSLSHPKTI